MPLWLPRVVLAVLATILALELLVIAPRTELLALVASAAWMALPGVAFTWRALGSTPLARASAWYVGPALGFGLSVFGLLLWWAAGLQNWLAILFAPVLTWALAVIAGRFGGPRIRLPALDARDAAAVAGVLLVVPLITFIPYDHVGEQLPEGDAYRAYFTADFVWAMTVTNELAKGDVPPANPFLSTQPMRYYWMSHLLSAAVYRNVKESGVSAEQVVLVNGLAFGLAFVAFCYWLARSVGAGPWTAALLIAIGFVANSYEGLDMLRSIVQRGESWEILRSTNIDAVTRWFYQGMPVDGLQRLLLYQPHHLTGYVLALAALWLIALAEDVGETSVALWAGIFLGLAFLFSTFTAIIVGMAVGVLYAFRLVQQKKLRVIVYCAVLGAAPVLVAIGISTVLGYTDPSEGMLLRFGLNPVALRRWPFVLLWSFGPLLIGGIAGLLRWRWVSGAGAGAAALVLSAIVFYFTADVPDMGGVWVGWRSGHLLLIGFAIITAAALSAWWQRRVIRPILVLVALVLVIPATPTAAIDVYNAQDVMNREEGPGFPWTLVLSAAERDAFAWIRINTARMALVQVEPYVRDAGTWAYVPAFAERRMAAGLPISMIPLEPYRQASELVRQGIFSAADGAAAHKVARSLRIDYLVVGDPERRAYPAGLQAIATRPDLFNQVFHNEALTVYRVVGE